MTDTIELRPAVATPDRWVPNRAGLIAVWRYWDETFTFHRGRLLLRGPNGAGKSMALEMLLPFLLDADASPGRLTSATKSRGSLYDRVMAGGDGQSRAGFVWVEFRRGADQSFTVGARLRASSASRSVTADFFTTSQAVGEDLRLLDAGRIPLSRKELADAIGDCGQVHTSAEEYRSVVRERLFPGFGPDRYASVITALLALRKEKLSQNLDLAKLSDVLTDALPPIDERDLAAVAEGFERLDRRRDEVAHLERDLTAVKHLARRQRAYARAVVAGIAGDVTSAEYRRDLVSRAEREARAALDRATTDDGDAAGRIAGLESRQADVAVEIDARRTSKAYRTGADLHNLRNHARQAGERAEADRQAVDARRLDAEHRSTEVDTVRGDRDRAASQVERALRDVGAIADVLGADHLTSDLGADPDDGEAFGLAWVTARREQTARVRAVLAEHARAVDRRNDAETHAGTDQMALDRALEQRLRATDELRESAARYSDDVTIWAGTCEAVGPKRVQAALGAPPYEPESVSGVVNRLLREIESTYAVAADDLDRQRNTAECERSTLLAEQAGLEAGQLPVPPSPAWRSDRIGRPGAPLWRLVEPYPAAQGSSLDGPPEAPAGGSGVDGLEAALDATGLLDAWVSPDGGVDLGEATDIVLTSQPLDGPTLAGLLDPLPDLPVPVEVIRSILASVAVGPSALSGGLASGGPDVLIGADGSFRLGAAVGRAEVVPAALLGAQARERRRLERLAQLAAALVEVNATLARLERDLVGLQRGLDAARADLAATPSREALSDAARSVERTEARAALAAEQAAQSRERLGEAEQQVRNTLRSPTTAAAQHGLPATLADLDRIDHALGQLDHRITTWAHRSHQLANAERTLVRAELDLVRAAELQATAEVSHDTSRRQAQDASVRLQTLESTAGVEYQAVLAEIGVLEAETRRAGAALGDLRTTRLTLQKQIGAFSTTVDRAERERIEVDTIREDAHRRLAAATNEGLTAEGMISPPTVPGTALDGVTATLAWARHIIAELDGVAGDETARQRASSLLDDRLHEARAALSSRHDLSRDFGPHGWWVLKASVDGLRRPVSELQASLDRTLVETRAELIAEEEELFEQTLAGSVRRSLANRIRQANHLVERVNDQLAVVRTAAAGVGVRLTWEVDPDQPAAVRSARSLLLKDHTTDEERRSLQDFVRARVDQARAELEHNAPWEARLRESLDYRAWHHFTLQISHRDWEGWHTATPRRLQRLSTGERSIALHLPMIASVAAHYADEDGEPSGCPRLILLDELFAGVDAANRAQLFGTFTAWNLDAVFTSDHEWCQYASLDGIAIHHLHPPAGEEPLISTRFTWDGHRRTIDPPEA